MENGKNKRKIGENGEKYEKTSKKSKKGVDIDIYLRYNGYQLSKSRLRPLQIVRKRGVSEVA